MLRMIPLTLALLALSAPISAEVVAPDKPSQIVHLRGGPGSGTNCTPFVGSTLLDHQLLPDGTTVPFTIPPGRVLVLTGVSWNLFGAPPTRGPQ